MNDRLKYSNQPGIGSNNFLKWPYLNKEYFLFYIQIIKKSQSKRKSAK